MNDTNHICMAKTKDNSMFFSIYINELESNGKNDTATINGQIQN